tara:strand:+ start:2150 stop:2953 length:804 start_codon:yes stop_codon:yes gene_type:complete
MNHAGTVLIARPRERWSHDLFRDLSTSHNPISTWTAATIPEAFTAVSPHTPEIVIVLQDTPDQFSRRDTDWLLATWPLARLIVCHGPWCNGDGRNRDYWPLGVRVPHTDATHRLRREFAALVRDGTFLPWTAGRDEIAAVDLHDTTHTFPVPFTYRVVSVDSPWKTLVSAQLDAMGGKSPAPCDTTTDLLLIDADPLAPSSLDDSIQSCKHCESKHILLLTHTPTTAKVLIGDSGVPNWEVHDKLVAASRPSTLTNSLGPSATRRIA